MSAPKNFAQTICQSFTGAVVSISIVPMRNSSEKERIVTSEVVIGRMKKNSPLTNHRSMTVYSVGLWFSSLTAYWKVQPSSTSSSVITTYATGV